MTKKFIELTIDGERIDSIFSSKKFTSFPWYLRLWYGYKIRQVCREPGKTYNVVIEFTEEKAV